MTFKELKNYLEKQFKIKEMSILNSKCQIIDFWEEEETVIWQRMWPKVLIQLAALIIYSNSKQKFHVSDGDEVIC